MPSMITPREVVENYFDRLTQRDELAFDLVAEDFIQHAAAPQGRDNLRQIALAIDSDLGHPEIVVRHVVASDDLVCVHVDLVGTHAGSTIPLLASIEPDQRSVTWSFMHLFRVVDGLIAEHWACRDDLGLLDQLGFGLQRLTAAPGQRVAPPRRVTGDVSVR